MLSQWCRVVVWACTIACLLNVSLSSPLVTQSCPEVLSVHRRVMNCVTFSREPC